MSFDRDALKARIGSGLERLWTALFSALSRLVAAPCRRLSADAGTRVLVIAPHPDDEAVGCAGAILLHRRAGAPVAVAYVTDGGASRALGLDAVEMARRRRGEAYASAAALGVEAVKWIGLPEGSWSTADAVAALRAVLAETEPDVVYAPSRIDFHPEHLGVAHALALALDASAHATETIRRPLVRIYQIQVPLTSALCNLVADVGSASTAIAAALASHVTQAASLRSAPRMRRYTAALHGIAGAAEAFWEMDAGQYCALHREPPAGWRRAFRGLRPSSFADPLAFVRGAGERRRLAVEAERARNGSG